MAQRKIYGSLPFDDAVVKLETLNKAMGKLWGAKWPDEENGKLGIWWRIGTLFFLGGGVFDVAMGKLETLAMMKLGPPDDLMGNWGPRPLIFKWLITVPLHSFKRMSPKFWEIVDVMRAEKEYMGPNSPLFLLYFKDCVMITNVWFWYFLSSILKLVGIHRVGTPSGYLKSFVFFSFLHFFLFYSSFSFLFSFLSLSSVVAPLAPGPWTLSTHATQSLRHCWDIQKYSFSESMC